MKANTAKPHTLVYGAGGASMTPLKQTGSLISEKSQMPMLDFTMAVLDKLSDPFHRFDMSARATTFDEKQDMKLSARNSYRPAIQPAWLKHDRQVLRFNAYFQEPVHENPKETYRIRPCTILLHLEDGTIMVSESKTENSGITQGTFVKRHRIPKQNDPDSVYSYEDFRVGYTVSLYSRSFRFVALKLFSTAGDGITLSDCFGAALVDLLVCVKSALAINCTGRLASLFYDALRFLRELPPANFGAFVLVTVRFCTKFCLR